MTGAGDRKPQSPSWAIPKRQRAGALQDAARIAVVIGERASVLDGGGLPPLSHGRSAKIRQEIEEEEKD